MTIVKIGTSVPTNVREWEKVFRPLNELIDKTPSGTTVTADNLPAQAATYVTLANNTTLPNDRALVDKAGETVVIDGGPGSSVQIGLADKGTPGEYPKVVTDSKGRVVAGAALLQADMPATLQMIYSGSGNPNGVVTASPGALYLNTAGGAGTTLYVKQSGTSNSGWTGK